MSKQNNTDILKEIINVMRDHGVEINSPFDVENWLKENANHSQMFDTGLFTEKVIPQQEERKKDEEEVGAGEN